MSPPSTNCSQHPAARTAPPGVPTSAKASAATEARCDALSDERHRAVLRQGFTIVGIEPELPNGKAPDFLVDGPDGQRFHLEATLASGIDSVAAGAGRRMREALQAIDDVSSPDIFLHLHTRGTPSQPIATARLRRAVQRFVDDLEYVQAVARAEAG